MPFEPGLREHFRRLNQQWLERYFRVEEVDRRIVRRSRRAGPSMSAARFSSPPMRARSWVPARSSRESEGVYELSKMGVDENYRGLGAGRKPLDEAIAEAPPSGRPVSCSWSRTAASIGPGMYERAGFVRQPSIRPGLALRAGGCLLVYQEAS